MIELSNTNSEVPAVCVVLIQNPEANYVALGLRQVILVRSIA